MRKLIHGLVDFRERLAPSYQETFARLAMGQKPDVLFVACSDSRVVPNLFASTEPGDLFVIRNVGNLVAPSDASEQDDGVNLFDRSEAAAIEYAVGILGVADIVVCGHSECGATIALLDENRPLSPNLKSWLRHGEPSIDRLQNGELLNSDLPLHNQLSQINVLQQIDHLRSYPLVKRALAENRLRLHAWYFNIGKVEVEVFDPNAHQFRPIDREMAESMLKSMGQENQEPKRESIVPWQVASQNYEGLPQAGASKGCCSMHNSVSGN